VSNKDAQFSKEEIQKLADTIAQDFKVDPQLLFKALPLIYGVFMEEGVNALKEPNKDERKSQYYADLVVVFGNLGRMLISSKVAYLDSEDLLMIKEALRWASGGLN